MRKHATRFSTQERSVETLELQIEPRLFTTVRTVFSNAYSPSSRQRHQLRLLEVSSSVPMACKGSSHYYAGCHRFERVLDTGRADARNELNPNRTNRLFSLLYYGAFQTTVAACTFPAHPRAAQARSVQASPTWLPDTRSWKRFCTLASTDFCRVL